MRRFLMRAAAVGLTAAAGAVLAQPYPARPVKIVVPATPGGAIDLIARGQAAGRFRRDVDPVEVHKAIAALGMFNVTNRYTFGAIFQRDMGKEGDVGRRRDIVADMIVSYLTCKRNEEEK